MKRIIFSFSILFSFFLLQSQNPTPQSFVYKKTLPTSFDAERLKRLDIAFEKLVEEGTIPHAVSFVVKRGEIVHHKAYGWRDCEEKIPCRKDDFFRMASQTKAITAVAVMMLFEEGKLLLDDPIKKHIPEFTNPQVLLRINEDSSFTTRPSKKDITIRHLLSHSSGIAYEGNDSTKKLYRKMNFPQMPLLSLEKINLKETVEKIAAFPLLHEPGENFTYGMSIDVLGYLIELLSGVPIDEYFKKYIFEPLGMYNTFFYLPNDKKKRLVVMYQKENGAALQRSGNNLFQTYPSAGAKTLCSTGAGLVGTIEDYAKFCQMILNGGSFNGKRILGRKTVDLMTRNQVEELRGDIGFGLAWDVFRPQYIHKTILSEGSLRWGGMFGTDYVIDPQEETILLLYTNLYPNNSGIDLKVLFHNLVYQAMN